MTTELRSNLTRLTHAIIRRCFGKFRFESHEAFVMGLYSEFRGRPPDREELARHVRALQNGLPRHALVGALLRSAEFEAILQRRFMPRVELPNLYAARPQCYREEGADLFFVAEDDERITYMEEMIRTCGYYDSFGAWSSSIDEDKKIVAQLVECFRPANCLEIGCFNGPILSLLQSRGIEVTGLDLSHLAFVTAFANVRKHLRWGDLLTAKLDRKFDCVLALDVLEHVSPLAVLDHIGKIKNLLAPDGVVILNSPMFGQDRIFGTVFGQYVREWIAVGDRDYFRYWPSDAQGWPIHGHMVLASPVWWEQRFAVAGLIRQERIERALHERLAPYFSWAPARKSLFILGHHDSRIDDTAAIEAIGKLAC